ncbi:ABC transporter permease [Streptomyces sp. NPDC001478]
MRTTGRALRAGHAEWTKLWTERVHVLLLLGAVAVVPALGAAVAATARCDVRGCGEDAVRLCLTGVTAAQVLVAVVAVLTAGDEYGTGMIRTTLTAVPARPAVLLSKAAVLGAAVLVAGAIGVLLALLAGGALLPGRGFTESHGYAPMWPLEATALRAAGGSVLCLALTALLGLGAVLLVRNSAAAIGIVLGVLFVLPVVARVVPDPDWQRHLQQFAPLTAGMSVRASTGLDRLPIGPRAGLGVVALWSLAALGAGAARLCARDA